jgi:hypothetical protein
MEYSDAKLTKLLGVHQKHDITYTCVSPSHQGYVKGIHAIGALSLDNWGRTEPDYDQISRSAFPRVSISKER